MYSSSPSVMCRKSVARPSSNSWTNTMTTRTARPTGTCASSDLNWMMKEKDVQFVAVCDVQKKRREAVKQLVDKHYDNKDCATYRDLREFRSELDDEGERCTVRRRL